MAKKKREEEWAPPEFDEVEFMKKEIKGARASIFSVLWAVPAALLGYVLTVLNAGAGPAIGFLIGLGMMYALKWILPLVKVDISGFKRRDWLGHGASFFFSWLAFWILLLNPPFADLTAPAILGIAVNGTSVSCGGIVSAGSGTVLLNVSASDNVAVSSASYVLGSSAAESLSRAGPSLWQATFPATMAVVTVTVADPSGHATSCQFSLQP